MVDSTTLVAVMVGILFVLYFMTPTKERASGLPFPQSRTSEMAFCNCAKCMDQMKRGERDTCQGMCDECHTCIMENSKRFAEGTSVPSQCTPLCSHYNMDFLQAPKDSMCGGLVRSQGNVDLGVKSLQGMGSSVPREKKVIEKVEIVQEKSVTGGTMLQKNRAYKSNDVATPMNMEASAQFHKVVKGWRPMQEIRGPPAEYVADGTFHFEPTLYHHMTAQRR